MELGRTPPALPRRKPRWRYWLARVMLAYVVVAPVVHVVGSVLHWGAAKWEALWVFSWVSCTIIVRWMVVSLFVFPIKYSVFGPYARTPLPDEKPIWAGESAGAVGHIGVSGDFISTTGSLASYMARWRVFRTGVAFKLGWFGSGFVHCDQFVSFTETYGGRWVLEHTSPELTRPLAFRKKELVAAVKRIMPPR